MDLRTYVREVVPGQVQFEQGYAVGYRDYVRFEEEKTFDADLVVRPSDSWIAGYHAGYRQAASGRSKR